jgi:zinc protease
MLRPHRFWLVLILTLTLAGIALAQKPDTTSPPQPAPTSAKLPRIAFTDTKLENGLRVILAPDHSAPVYAISVIYNVGSRNERPGRTGFAHLFEHMMFEGSEKVGKGEHFILVYTNGGGMNGTTNEDRTVYFEALPKNQLELGLFLEADRMRSLNVTEANFENQRQAVEEERRLSVDNQPYGRTYEEIDILGYDNFAYKHSTIGWMHDLDAARLEDVQEFHKIYYAPNNAVLVLVGDFDPDDAMARIKKNFSDIAVQPVPPAMDLWEPAHDAERREVMYDALARLPKVLVSYHIPAGNTPDNYAGQVLGMILSTGESSRLYQHLVKDKQLATEIDVSPDARIGPSMFYIDATPRPGVDPRELEKAIYAEIEAVKTGGVTDAELEKARTQYLRRQIQQRTTVLTTALRMSNYAVYFNDPDLINTIYDKFAAVTADQVKAFAQKYLIENERNVVIDIPKPKTPTPSAGGAQ